MGDLQTAGCRVLDGVMVGKAIRDDLAGRVVRIQQALGRAPALGIVLVGTDPASEVYVRNKVRTGGESGLMVDLIRLPAEWGMRELQELALGLRSFRGQSSLSTWLYRIGFNVCLNRVSAKAPLEKMTDPIGDRQYLDTRSQSAPERLLQEERRGRVRAAIAELPRKQRATLILRMYHEMSHQEIADVLGSSVGAVKANFFHALGNLKKQLGDENL